MLPIAEALKIITGETPRLVTEHVALPEVVGRVLAEGIFADVSLPPFDRSQMDGFAVKSDDVRIAPVELRIVGESAAGRGWKGEMNAGEAVRIMTGAPVPNGADSVQKVELTSEENGFIRILEPSRPEQNIVRKAAEVKAGEKIFECGDIVTENMVATLASFGYETLLAAKRPRVSILATGSEIVAIGKKPSGDQIRNSNSVMLAAFTQKFGDVEVLPIALDDLDGLKTAIMNGLDRCDVLIISGGVSVGDYDYTKPALREIGAEIYFDKISLKPGKPTVFAKFGEKLIFGLPGNPVSTAVTFFVFVRLALLLMQGAARPNLRSGFAELSHPVKAAPDRDSMLPVSLENRADGQLMVATLRFSGSSNFVAFARAEALVFVPKNKPLEKGDVAEILYLG